VSTGIGLILIGFAIFAMSRPYVEMAAGGDVPAPAPRWASMRRKAIRFTRRSGAVMRVGIGQIIGAIAIIAGVVIVVAH
jgi:hypothetical protein